MKRRVLCAFALIFWLLAVCTFLSLRIEELMVPVVTVTEPVMPRGSNEGQLPLDCLFEGTLYQTYEGSGWEQGTRVTTVEPSMYEILPDYIKLNWGKIIQYATKTPRIGELVNVVQMQKREDDVWLAVSADGKALPELGEHDGSVEIEDQTDTALLLFVKDLPQPFMEKRAQSMVPILPGEDDFSLWTNANGEIDWEQVDWAALEEARPKEPNFYSLNDVEQWAAQLPKLGLFLGMFLFSLIIWAHCCALSRQAQARRKLLIFNAAMVLVLLASMPLLLRRIDLPSSLLPVNNIVEISHYRAEFSQINSALQSLAKRGSQQAAEVLDLTRRNIFLLVCIFGLCGVFGVLVAWLESLLRTRAYG